jgi:hypothetical protein
VNSSAALANAVRVDVDADAASGTLHVFTGFQLSTEFQSTAALFEITAPPLGH